MLGFYFSGKLTSWLYIRKYLLGVQLLKVKNKILTGCSAEIRFYKFKLLLKSLAASASLCDFLHLAFTLHFVVAP